MEMVALLGFRFYGLSHVWINTLAVAWGAVSVFSYNHEDKNFCYDEGIDSSKGILRVLVGCLLLGVWL